MKSLAKSAAGAFIAGSLCYGSGSSADVLPFDENVPPGIAISGADAIVGDPGPPSTRPTGPVQGEYIIMFEDTVTDARGLANAIARRNGLTIDHVYENAIKGFSATMPEALAQMLASDPSVASVEQNQYVQAHDLVTGVERVGILNNYQSPLGVELDGDDSNVCSGNSECVDVDVAVIDGGIDPNHPDLNVHRYVSCIGQSIISQGCSNATTEIDETGHGTHVAGTIGAVDGGVDVYDYRGDGVDYEVVGVAPGARIWAVKVMQNGSGTLADIVAGVDYVTANSDEIEVANMSLGFKGCASAAMQSSVANAVAAGVVIVGSAGNSMGDIYGENGSLDGPSRSPFRCTGDDFQPAAYLEVLTVTAMADFDGVSGGFVTDRTVNYTSGGQPFCTEDGDDTMACYSNFSGNVTNNNPVSSPGMAADLTGPGVDILSTLPVSQGSYGRKDGTSMSAPHVAGAVALYIAQNDLTPANADDVYGIRQELINSAESQYSWGPDLAGDSTATDDPDGFFEGLVNVEFAAAPPLDNRAPTAQISSWPCADLTCTFNGSGSSDPDGDQLTYSWDFGDQSPPGSGVEVSHTYSTGGDYTVTLTVTDGEFPDSDDQTVSVSDASDPPPAGGITLVVDPYKVRGNQKVDLDWSGATTNSVRIHRDTGDPIVQFNDPDSDLNEWTDNIDQKGGGSYQYRVCEWDGLADGICSDPETATF